MENIKVKNGMKNFTVITFISSWLVQLFPLFKGTQRTSEMIILGTRLLSCFSLTTHSPSVLPGQEHSGEIDFGHDSVGSCADLLSSETGENYKNNGKQQQKLFRAFGNGPKGKEQRRKHLFKKTYEKGKSL